MLRNTSLSQDVLQANNVGLQKKKLTTHAISDVDGALLIQTKPRTNSAITGAVSSVLVILLSQMKAPMLWRLLYNLHLLT